MVRCSKEMMQLYAVTDRAWVGEMSFLEQVEAALKGGITCLQLREKDMPQEKFLSEALEVSKLCKKYKVPFIINDNIYVAVKCGADGVHLGQDDMDISEARSIVGDNMIIGVSTHNLKEALKAEKDGADYIGMGAVFTTSTKNNTVVITKEEIKKISEQVHIPKVAIGGIKKENIMELSGTGTDGVAVVSGIFSAIDIEKTTREYLRLSKIVTSGNMRKALTIAGSDSCGGAGVQADIKTITMNGVYAMSAITALTAQNTLGVKSVMDVTPKFLEEQIDAVFEDIVPDAVKIGMVSNSELIKVIAKKLKEYNAVNVVVDPVMVATSGSRLIAEDAIDVLKSELLPLADIITPNIPEMEILSGCEIKTEKDFEKTAALISETYNCSVLCKGGHSINDANDYLYSEGKGTWFYGNRIDNPNTHGTGCTLSSAIASNLAKGYSMEEAVRKSKEYISEALNDMLDLGKGSGPLNHGFILKKYPM